MTSAVTTHVLDTARGRPAAGVPVRLEQVTDAGAGVLAESVTDGDGRVAELGPERLDPGTYRLVFDVAAYASSSGQDCFFPEVALSFTASGPTSPDGAHYHVPLLLSPFAYSTYRGS
ncbi:MAG: hydroxyisourate hydrolase [Marmoricola sp.]